ncbi:fluoride efflux transporter CrcB [Nocardia farcinica]|uniref:fluoride efflux transporter CrcB n=1 Tax=Nocardia farcinica TaxID=37329 RepID=UPI000A365BC3|nr:fluoride efflux transporter CrcB [Nocardia farcinica]MBA4854773.1 fluoride efflux transporter CrcB [Nocardia farcinica]MBC9815064.1 fluoride efflux transporter CrcB [Nocardia farcinica]MCZ9330207.1 fluoride efflux transporter CrcB [Nocardia farcinica]
MSAPARVPPLDPAVLLAISLGGGLGALLRYLISTSWPTPPGHVPWATFVVNVTGCFAIGVLMVLVTEAWVTHRLLRPFAGVGLLGGFTTFSTYGLEIRTLLESGAVLEALGYLAGTVLAALAGVVLGTGAARWATGAARR